MREAFLRVGGKVSRVEITPQDDVYILKFGFNQLLLDEIKATFDKAKWNPVPTATLPAKVWTIDKSEHTDFRLYYMENGAGLAYRRWDQPLCEYNVRPKIIKKWSGEIQTIIPFDHQVKMTRRGLTSHYCIWAAEMGTGKSLSIILLMEENDRLTQKLNKYWWVAPKAALEAVRLEYDKWQCHADVEFLTYEGLQKRLIEWKSGEQPPVGIWFDEASRLKNATTKRSQAARYIARHVRSVHGDRGFIIAMSGSPAPKSPVDWWNICETVWPGFLREGNQHKFLHRLAITRMESSSVTGGRYPKHIAWRDKSGVCNECGETKEHINHTPIVIQTAEQAFASMTEERNTEYHEFVPGVNEVAKLYERMKGLVEVIFKKDCLDLPEKVYQQIIIPPSKDMLRAMKLIKNSGIGAAQILTGLRELSDGFQYNETVTGSQKCPMCLGLREVSNPDPDGPPKIACQGCYGQGIVQSKERITIPIDCPKDDALLELIENHEDVGRLVVYGGFTATLDRIQRLITKKAEEWRIIRVDGGGWWNNLGKDDPDLVTNNPKQLLQIFQEGQKEHPGIIFLAHPGSAGMGLTLTASPSIVYYSNTFNAEERIQSEDRIHRPGCTGANIYDLIHLPSDLLVLENLQKKRELQGLTMGELNDALASAGYHD